MPGIIDAVGVFLFCFLNPIFLAQDTLYAPAFFFFFQKQMRMAQQQLQQPRLPLSSRWEPPQYVGQVVLASFSFELLPNTLTTVRTSYTSRLRPETFGLVVPRPELSALGVDLKVMLLPINQTCGTVDLILDCRRTHPVRICIGQPLAQVVVVPSCVMSTDIGTCTDLD